MSPELRAEIENVLIKEYSDLRVIEEANEPHIVGSFPLVHCGDVIDRFQIKISFPEGYPADPPIVREVGRRIPNVADRHNSDGVACLFVPFEWKMKRPDLSFRTFISGPVHNYFLSQRYFEIHGKWPFGDRDHGAFGEVVAACDLVGIAPTRWRDLFLMLRKSTVRGHWRCPCGSGKRLRDCHLSLILALRDNTTSGWAQKKMDELEEWRRLNAAAIADKASSNSEQRRAG